MSADSLPPSPLPRAVVIHTGGIGDLILTSPAIARLAETHAVDLVGYTDRLALLIESGIAQRAVSLDVADIASLFSTPSPRLNAFLNGADFLVLWMSDEDGRLARVLTQCGVPNVRCMPGLPGPDWAAHASDYYWRAMGCTGEAPLPRLVLGTAGSLDYDVILHPGSGATTKNWPRKNFEAVARALTKQGLRVAWALGPAERERMNVHGKAYALQCDSLPEMPLTDLGRALAATRLYIGNDSGATHLAAAVGCPTLAIFGPTNPAVWGARGSHVRIVQGTPWPDVQEVLLAADCLLLR